MYQIHGQDAIPRVNSSVFRIDLHATSLRKKTGDHPEIQGVLGEMASDEGRGIMSTFDRNDSGYNEFQA